MTQNTAGKVISCRAAVAWETGKPLTIETIQVDPPKANEVRVKIVTSGVCHTDATSLYGVGNKIDFPAILGHEGAGIIESVGEAVTEFKPGDHVILLYNPQCGKCKLCKNPKTNLCEQLMPHLFGSKMPDGTSRFTCKGQKVSHFMGCSTFSEYTVIPEWGVCKISNKIPLNRAALLGCSVPSGYGTATKSTKVDKGSTCAIWGLGGVGLACAIGCKDSGASKIVGIDVNPDKFEIAKKLGVTECLNPKDYDKPMQEVLKEKTGGKGFDYTFECAGHIDSMMAALESAAAGYGTTIICGATAAGEMLNISPVYFLMGHTVKGNIFGGMEGKKDLPKLVDKYLDKKLPLDDFVSHEYPFEKINALIEAAHNADCIRCLVNY